MPKLTNKISKMPYTHTQISPEETRMNIENLLEQCGIKDYQWTFYKGMKQLQFIWNIKVNDNTQKELTSRFRPPVIMALKKSFNVEHSRYEKINVPLDAVSYRMLWYYLKVKLEAIKWGMETVEKEFMSHIVMQLPNGEEIIMGEIITNNKALEALNVTNLMLEQKPTQIN